MLDPAQSFTPLLSKPLPRIFPSDENHRRLLNSMKRQQLLLMGRFRWRLCRATFYAFNNICVLPLLFAIVYMKVSAWIPQLPRIYQYFNYLLRVNGQRAFVSPSLCTPHQCHRTSFGKTLLNLNNGACLCFIFLVSRTLSLFTFWFHSYCTVLVDSPAKSLACYFYCYAETAVGSLINNPLL